LPAGPTPRFEASFSRFNWRVETFWRGRLAGYFATCWSQEQPRPVGPWIHFLGRNHTSSEV